MKKFDPKPGDTIVCFNGDKYICIPRNEYQYLRYYPGSVICAVTDVNKPTISHMNWDNHDGLADGDDSGHSISHIIPGVSSKAHKHADLIKQWADNKDLKFEFRRPEVETWTDCDMAPNWSESFEYRIKPEPKPDMVLYGRMKDYAQEMDEYPQVTDIARFKFRHDNLKFTFDGETGKLKSAEVI